MFDNLIKYCFPSIFVRNDEPSTETTTPVVPSDTRIDIERKEFLQEVGETWSFIHELTHSTIRFREIYDLYKYEPSESKKNFYFNQLKTLDDTTYKLSLTIHQRIQSLEQIVQPLLNEFRINKFDEQESNTYIPAYVRIAQNQLYTLKLSFKRIIMKHNSDSIEYQNDLKRSLDNERRTKTSDSQISRTTINKIKNLFNSDEEDTNIIPAMSQEQIQLQISKEKSEEDLREQEMQIANLEARLESVRLLKGRVRQMK